MRTLIFATENDSEYLKFSLDARVFNHSSQEPGSVRNLLRYLDEDDNATAILVGDAFVMGWASSHPTHVLFSRNYPNAENIRTQARMRVQRLEVYERGSVLRITKENIDEQMRKDRAEIDALPDETRKSLERQVAIIREPSHTNFSDPEAL